MTRFLRPLAFISGLGSLLLAIGFGFKIPWVLAICPWNLDYSPLSATFIASILIAIALPTLWIAWRGEIASAFGGAINLCVTFGGIGIFCLQLYSANTSRQAVLMFGLFCLASVLVLIGVAWQTWGLAYQDARPTPRLVRFSFAFFAIALFLVGGALILKTNNIFPWNLSEELRVLYGWIFLGAMCYLIYALLTPKWGNAQGQLLGFLGYDLVLIVPFIQHFSRVIPEQRLSLTIYVGVLIYSGLIASYYLFIHPQTRLWSLPH